MYLSKIHVKNFRCIDDLKTEFHPGLNILIGENDSGKTAIIDALCWCFELGSEQKTYFIRLDDLHINDNGYRAEGGMEFHLTFSDLSEEEQGIFIELLAIPEQEDSEEKTTDKIEPELQLHVRFPYDKDKDQLSRPRYWGGEKEGQSIPPEVLELIYCTYLSALRDAVRDLRPSKGNQLSQLFVKLRPDNVKQDELAGQIHTTIKDLSEWQVLLKEGKDRIEEHLKEVTLSGAPQEADIDFVQREFRKIVEGLRVSIPIRPTANEDMSEPSSGRRVADLEIWQNGLGYNNLIYVATVLGNLRERKRAEPSSYVALLIEEPEAHLHPQLQNIFFRYLQTMAGEQIQVFVTSHSPTITSKTHLDSLIALSKTEEGISALPLANVELEDKNKKYLERFLDVTKSQLFFAKGVILVEGISEALLLPCFADLMMEQDNYLEKKAIEIVNINGVAFEPFAKLFKSADVTKRLNVRCVIITDDDRDPTTGEISARAKNAQALSSDSEMLKTVLAERTLEFEMHKSNVDLLEKLYAELHKKAKANSGTSQDIRRIQFVKIVEKEKAIFAQHLAFRIKEDPLFKGFQVPQYIKDAILWVTDSNVRTE